MKTIMILLFLWLQTFGIAGIIWPVYGNTQGQYDKVVANASKVETIAIINPINGSGYKYSSFVKTNVDKMKRAGVKVYGYVNTFYTKRTINSTLNDCDRYIQWYKVDGIFFDEVSDKILTIPYYKKLKDTLNLPIIGNPGTNVVEAWAPVFDIIITFENAYTQSWINNKQKSWTLNYVPEKTGAIIYGVPSYRMTKVVDRARLNRFGWIFVTDRKNPDPFGISSSHVYNLYDYMKK